MRIESTAASVSWIPSESIGGLLRGPFDVGITHYDQPPPDRVRGYDEAHRLAREDKLRFANVVGAWAEVEDGRISSSGWSERAGLVMGSTTVRVAKLGVTFRGSVLPTLRRDPEATADRAVFTQTVGCRTGLPLPRPVRHPPYAQWQAPVVWTTLSLTLHANGSSEVALDGASAFPRHWVYGPDGALALKTGVTDQRSWVGSSFGVRTPWGAADSAPLVVAAAESELERQLSAELMHASRTPEVRRLPAGTAVTREGEDGNELFLLLDGVLRVEVGGVAVAEVGPGAVLGERALLEGGRRTSTLVAVTPVRLAVAAADTVDLDRLRTLADLHRREDGAR